MWLSRIDRWEGHISTSEFLSPGLRTARWQPHSWLAWSSTQSIKWKVGYVSKDMKNVPHGFDPGDLMRLMLWVDELEAVTNDCWSIFYSQNFQFKAYSESLREKILHNANIIEPISLRNSNLFTKPRHWKHCCSCPPTTTWGPPWYSSSVAIGYFRLRSFVRVPPLLSLGQKWAPAFGAHW